MVDRPVKRVADESSDRHSDDAGETEGKYAAPFQRPRATDRR